MADQPERIHKQVTVDRDGEPIEVDEQLGQLLPLLWWFGINTDRAHQDVDAHNAAQEYCEDHMPEPDREPHAWISFVSARDLFRFVELLEDDHSVGDWEIPTLYDGGLRGFAKFPLSEVPAIVKTLRRKAVRLSVPAVPLDESLWEFEGGRARLTSIDARDAEGLRELAAQALAAAEVLDFSSEVEATTSPPSP